MAALRFARRGCAMRGVARRCNAAGRNPSLGHVRLCRVEVQFLIVEPVSDGDTARGGAGRGNALLCAAPKLREFLIVELTSDSKALQRTAERS